MKKLKIGQILLYTFVSVMIYMLIIAVVDYKVIQKVENNGNILYENYGKVQGDIGMGYAYFQDIKVNLRNSLYMYLSDTAKRDESIKAISTVKEKMETELEEAEEYLADVGDLHELLHTAKENIDAYYSDVEQCITYLNAGDIDAAREHLKNNGVASANAAGDSIETLVSNLQEEQQVFLAEQRKVIINSNVGIGIFLFFVIITVVLTCITLCKIIRDPLVKLAKVSKKVSMGDVSNKMAKVEESPNEVSILHNSFCDMMDNLERQAKALEELASGNLDIEYKAVSDKDVVGNAIEKLIRDDNTAFGTIMNATNQISIGSGQIAAASQTLAQGSTEQASAIQQIAASITDIANKTKDNANQANEVNNIVVQAKDDVVAGNQRMNEMVEAMREINDASENIQKIIKVIDDIAFNTNILALNATVEAARAGEQGKGFAVVAEEVRNLAGRSAEASSQTAEMIEDSIAKVRRGSELAKDTAEALAVISDMIDRITGLSANIATASNDQASATAQIDQALMQVSQVVQTNSATSQQCASASEELSGQARGLEREVSKFKLKDVIGVSPSQTLEYDEPMRLGNSMDTRY